MRRFRGTRCGRSPFGTGIRLRCTCGGRGGRWRRRGRCCWLCCCRIRGIRSARTGSGRRLGRRCWSCPGGRRGGMLSWGRMPGCGAGCWHSSPILPTGTMRASRPIWRPGAGWCGRRIRGRRRRWWLTPLPAAVPFRWKRCGWAARLSPATSIRWPVSFSKRCWRIFPGGGRNWPRSCGRRAPPSRGERRRNWPTYIPRTRTGQFPLPTCGRGRCAAKVRTAARKSRCCAPGGCAASPSGGGRCARKLSATQGRRPGWSSGYLRQQPTGKWAAARWRGRGLPACAATPCCRRNGCGRSWRRSAGAPMRCLTRTATVAAGRG